MVVPYIMPACLHLCTEQPNNHRRSSSKSTGTCMPCFQAWLFLHQDEICSCIVTGIHSEGQSAQPVEAEEEAPEPQDGSLWWHGMFIRAGRMGNMASDVRSDGQEQGKKVLHSAVSFCLLNQFVIIFETHQRIKEAMAGEST